MNYPLVIKVLGYTLWVEAGCMVLPLLSLALLPRSSGAGAVCPMRAEQPGPIKNKRVAASAGPIWWRICCCFWWGRRWWPGAERLCRGLYHLAGLPQQHRPRHGQHRPGGRFQQPDGGQQADDDPVDAAGPPGADAHPGDAVAGDLEGTIR